MGGSSLDVGWVALGRIVNKLFVPFDLLVEDVPVGLLLYGGFHPLQEQTEVGFAPAIAQKATAIAGFKVGMAIELMAIDGGQNQGIDDGGPKFFDEVGGEGRMAIVAFVEAALVGIEVLQFDQGEQMVPEHLIAKAEQGVDGVAGRSARSPFKAKVGMVETGAKGTEVGGGGGSFETTELVKVIGAGQLLEVLGENG